MPSSIRNLLRHRCFAWSALTRAALLVLAIASAAACPVGAAIMVPPEPYRPKDFSLVKKDGVYHLFYIRNNVYVTQAETEKSFGHATSPDLYYWTQRDTVLPVNPSGWDNSHVWAPHVFESQGLWWMVYTGVTDQPGSYYGAQRMGLAVSSDLDTWTRVGDLPVFDASQVPWAWWEPRNPGMAFRDPFVMPDPQHPGEWLVYYTATPRVDTTATMIGVARTQGGSFSSWSDVKPLWITYHTYTFNTLTESPHLFQHDGRWFMFITSNAGQPLTFYSTLDPTADPAQWTYHGRLRNILGYDTRTWYASEYLRDGTHDYFAFVSGDRVDIREMAWSGPTAFYLVPPSLFHVRSVAWSRDSVVERSHVSLRYVLANPYAGTAHVEAVVLDEDGVETPAPLDSLGIAEFPEIVTDTLSFEWSARMWPATEDTSTVMRLRIRLKDRTAESGVLVVRAAPARPPRPPIDPPHPPDPGADPPVPPGDGGEEAPPEFPDPQIEDRPRGVVGIRGISRVPLGGGPGVAVTLDQAAAARVDVYDLQGRRLRNLADRELPAGTTVLAWDGRDDQGTAAPRGMYFVRFASNGRVSTARLLIGW